VESLTYLGDRFQSELPMKYKERIPKVTV